MKTVIISQQLVSYRNMGHLRLENYPFEHKIVRTFAKNSSHPRDLWRKIPQLKKRILQEFAPIALELVNKTFLRLACDHYFETLPDGKTFKDLFCFQNIACVFVLSEDETGQTNVDIFEPSSLIQKVSYPAYMIVFGFDTAVIVDNPKDPYSKETRNLGYVFGDRLTNPHHPLISRN